MGAATASAHGVSSIPSDSRLSTEGHTYQNLLSRCIEVRLYCHGKFIALLVKQD